MCVCMGEGGGGGGGIVLASIGDKQESHFIPLMSLLKLALA